MAHLKSATLNAQGLIPQSTILSLKLSIINAGEHLHKQAASINDPP
jgi:hypothetical protein